jgi:pimeloyl-ACP methyl ester carboxylesterase
MRSLATRHVKLYVREMGSHADPAILFLHGSPLSGRMWEPQLERLPDFHCLAPDLPSMAKTLPSLWSPLYWGGRNELIH